MPAESPLPTPAADWAGGLKNGLLLGAAVLALILPPPAAWQSGQGKGVAAAGQRRAMAVQGAPQPRPARADFAGEPARDDVRRVADWIARSGDHRGLYFVILDKPQARLFVFGPDARLRGASPVLLGYAVGDDSVEGIGNRPIAEVRPEERTTPAGRFLAEPGRNALGEDVVWVDYDAAVSMHRVRATDPKERRLERLASPTIDDNRISYGCINLPVAFFENVVAPAFAGRYGMVYVMPEVRDAREVFAAAFAEPDAVLAARP